MNDESPQPATPAECHGLAGALQNCVVTGVVVFDPQGRVSSITPEASRMLRLTAAQAVGQSASVLPDALRALVNDSLATGAVRELAKSILLPHPGGTVHVVATPMQQGRARSGVVLVLHELSLAPIEESIDRKRVV